MLKTYASRMAAGAVISAALTAGSLGLTATAASACTDPRCISGVPPVAASAMECTNPKCLSGIPPVAASAMECTNPNCVSGTPPAGHGGPARAAGGVSTAASAAVAHAGTSIAVNCPPTSSNVRDPGSGGC